MNSAATLEAVRERLANNVTFLPDKPEENPDSTARALWLRAAGIPVSAQGAATLELPQLNERQEIALAELVSRRIAGVPLAHLTERQRFLGMEMLVGPDALVPRKETELLASAAIELIAQDGDRGMDCNVIDVCTGSGNVALAIAHHVSDAQVHASDLSEDAVALARRNSAQLGLDARVSFRCGDLLAPFEVDEFLGRIDLLTCNPPYINSAKVERMPEEIAGYEPRLAFDGGALGISILMRLIREAPRFIRSGGWLAFEVGLGQGPALVKRMQANPAYRQVNTRADDTGAVRVVMGQC